jgi:hypothetical protein
VKNLGDGFPATLDGPARAIRCAAAISDAVQPLGIAVRSGLHTGEIELMADDVTGIAVHIAARVAAEAEAGETVVSPLSDGSREGTMVCAQGGNGHVRKKSGDPASPMGRQCHRRRAAHDQFDRSGNPAHDRPAASRAGPKGRTPSRSRA